MIEWISVETRLPEEGWHLISDCSLQVGNISIGRFCNGKWENVGFNFNKLYDHGPAAVFYNEFVNIFEGDITHWMPLPGLPEVKDD